MKVLLFADHVGQSHDFHPAIREMLNHPADGVYYIEEPVKKTLVKRIMWKAQPFKPIFSPLTKEQYDLIHTSDVVAKTDARWVYQMEGLHPNHKIFHDEFLKRTTADNCKKIIPWSNAAKREIVRDCPQVEEKIEVVQPTVYPKDYDKNYGKDTINILFVSRRGFFQKGGRELLLAYRQISSKYNNVRLNMICNDVPESFKKDVPNANFLEPMPRDRLEAYYKDADIYVLPQYGDTYNMSCIEAMSYGIPIITTNIFANPEFCFDGETGFLLQTISYFEMGKPANFDEIIQKTEQPNVVSQIVDRISMLVEDVALRERMGRAAKNEVDNGRLSYKLRNEKLKRIYEVALSG